MTSPWPAPSGPPPEFSPTPRIGITYLALSWITCYALAVVIDDPAELDGLTPGELSTRLEVPATTLSFHLKELMHADLVTQERAGRHLIYRAQFEQMHAVLAYLTDNCCQGEPCAAQPALACDC